ncbi:MAG: hypothetical protein Athens071416_626 [Parcubacteria group bacterium Athens0714_16]|nr:MAG: hypothetical protein Athens071416_626 [Parcubacteria group bacterium Athens0714_16]
MNKKSIFNKIFGNKTEKFRTLGIMLFLGLFLLLPIQQIHADEAVLSGSIKVCAISVDQNFQPINDSKIVKPFEFSQNLTNMNAEVIKTSEIDATKTNVDILKDIKGNDANCIVYQGLNLGTYYYNQVKNDSSFSSFYNNNVGNNSSFGNSSLETEFYKHNMSSDSLGFLTLSKENPNKVVVILNVYKNIVKNTDNLVISSGNWAVDLNSPYTKVSLRTSFDQGILSRTNETAPLEKITDSSRTFKKGILAIEGDPIDPPPSPNSRPVLILTGGDLALNVGDTYVEPGFTATDNEDGDITSSVVVSGSVNTSVAGVYTLTYNVIDSGSLSAIEQTRIITVNSVLVPNSRPVIVLEGNASITITRGDSYTDLGATASDLEDGNITANIIKTGAVDTSTVGTYTLRYNVNDSAGLSAIEVTRIVIVQNPIVPPVIPPVTPPSPPSGGGGGGGGGIFIQKIVITNEKITKINDTTVLVSWTTNLPATSRVAYGIYSLNNDKLDLNKNDYGYGNTNVEYTALTYTHAMTVSGLTSGAVYYFRPNSLNSNSPRVIGIELKTPTGSVLGQCNYLLEFLKLDANNSPQEVTKLQIFLRNYEGFKNLNVTGVFDQETYSAVIEFQNKYKTDILLPWNHNEPTGFVYITTKKKINEIYCQKELPLSVAEKTEIERFKIQTGTVIEEADKERIEVGDIIGKANESTSTTIALIETEGSTTTIPSTIASTANKFVATVIEIPNQVVTSIGNTARKMAKGVYKSILGFSRLFKSSN